MEVNEQLEQEKNGEVLLDAPPEAAPAEDIPAPASGGGPSWLRLAYSVEFLIALVAIFTTWSQVGGQGHLDLLPWYTKLACVLALAWCTVRFTAALVEEQKGWNRRSMLWFTGMIVMGIVMGGITFYYHLHEVTDEQDSDETTTSASRMTPAIVDRANTNYASRASDQSNG
jgi:hypothetical protein